MRRGAASVAGVVGLALLASLSVLGAGACGDYGPVTLADADTGDAATITPNGVGAACSESVLCRAGLTCAAGKCAPSHALESGASCTISAECKDGLYCNGARKCSPTGSHVVGDSCGSDASCASHLRCNPIGLTAECAVEGAADVGASCKLNPECFAGLLCIAGKCAPPPATSGAAVVAVSGFAGVTCQDDPALKAYFTIPRGTKDDGDFFRLPFPNDVRKKNGRVDLTGFPTPGADVLGFDLVDRWARYVEESESGFSVYPTMIMRFSATPALDTLKAPGVLRLVDVTTGTTPVDVGFGWSASSTRTKYVCANAVVARPTPGGPLQSGHTYAFVLTNGAKGAGGAAIGVSTDLKSLLGAADPGGALSAGWNAYAPLRAWASSTSFDLATLVNASVFTVGKHTDLVAKLDAAIEAAPPAPITSWTRCGTTPSPCPQADGARACGSSDAFDELHALVTLPNWQKGVAPYTSITDGDLVVDASGVPAQQGTTQVCLSLTIPKNAAMPAAGWPLAIYTPDTGGSFRSQVVDGIATRFTSADGGAAKLAVLTIDQVEHGTRRGTATARPDQLTYQTANPRVLHGNGLQAAADLLALARLAPSFSLPAQSSPNGFEIRFANVVLVGHGRGANATALAAPRATAKGVLVGGVGASFLDAVVVQHAPVDLADVAPAVLGEVTLASSHPVLGMFQNALDPIDPLAHASLVATAPPTSPKQVFVVYGENDTFTPGVMQSNYTIAAALGVAYPAPSALDPDAIGGPLLPTPAGGNLASGDVTALVRQYDRGSYDGHLIMLLAPQATLDGDRFVTDVALARVPMVGR